MKLINHEEMALMVEAQEVLNKKYNGDQWRLSVDIGKAKFALLDEVSEFAREIKPTWKWWGGNQGEIDPQKATFELIDVMHFALLVALHRYPVDILAHPMRTWKWEGDMWGPHTDKHNQFVKAIQRFLQAVDLESRSNVITGLFNIAQTGGELLNLAPGQIYEAYKLKNALNHKRVEGGVMQGLYDKSQESELSL